MTGNEIILYQPDETVKLEVRLCEETVWLNRNQMATLFGRDVKTIGKHIANALAEELSAIPTVANFATVQSEGGRRVTRNVEYYNLDMILSVGYRVKSQQGVLFRQWANRVLKEYLLKGYSVNQRMERLEQRVTETNQYEPIDLSIFTKSHDRFLIIDSDVYHIGASIKDLGKRWFAFCKMQLQADEMITKLI